MVANSPKLNIFSFSVLVLEIITGRRNNYAVNSKRLLSCKYHAYIARNREFLSCMNASVFRPLIILMNDAELVKEKE